MTHCDTCCLIVTVDTLYDVCLSVDTLLVYDICILICRSNIVVLIFRGINYKFLYIQMLVRFNPPNCVQNFMKNSRLQASV